MTVSQADHIVSHSARERTEKGLEEVTASGDLRRGNVNGGFSWNHDERQEVEST